MRNINAANGGCIIITEEVTEKQMRYRKLKPEFDIYVAC